MKLKFDKVVKNVKTTLTEHSPEILTGIGVAGMITTTVLAVRATPKALQLIEEKRKEVELETGIVDVLPPVEIVKTAWKCYLPAALTGVFSISCLIGANSVNARRNAALATAYKLSETALMDYREKVVETLGENKDKQIREQIDKDRIEKNPVSNNEIIITDKGKTLCYDHLYAGYFESSIDAIDRAVNRLNKQMLVDDYVSLNDFYDELGLKHKKNGYELGWSVTKGLIEVSYSTQLADDERTPCIVLDYNIAPRYGFDRFA